MIANSVVARVGSKGDICLFSSASAEVIVDVAGYLTGPAPADSDTTCPMAFPANINSSLPPYYPVGPYQLPAGRYRAPVTTAVR